jgi:hypothetical protein
MVVLLTLLKNCRSSFISYEGLYLSLGANVILLFESKDFFSREEIKLSYDFDKIEAELRNNSLEKAVKQLERNIRSTIEKQSILDDNVDAIVEIKKEDLFKDFDFTKIALLSIVEIDTLFLYLTHFQNGQMDLLSLLKAYHEQAKFRF